MPKRKRTVDPVVGKAITKLVHNPKDYNTILDLYFSKSVGRNLTLSDGKTIITVRGVGHDGELQYLRIISNGEIVRYYADTYQLLPSDTGKVLYMLLKMGYGLAQNQLRQARLYHQYVTTGISNLK